MPRKKVAGPGNKSGARMAKERKVEESVDKEPDVENLKDFKKFYKMNDLVPLEKWNNFMTANTTKPPLSFRFIESFQTCPSHIDTVPGVPTQARVLMQYMKSKHVDTLSKMTVDAKTNVRLDPLPWYPKELGWCLNIPKADSEKYLGLKKFDEFLSGEKAEHHVQSIETWSMVPAVLMDFQSHHVVLDMCSAPGFIASQVSEAIHSEPLQSNAGLLILNDLHRLNDGMNFFWTQGTKVVFSNLDARTFPELYLDDKKTFAKALRYDRILCDPKCSSDGIMRKNESLQDTWSPNRAMRFHQDQKDILKRAIELVKVGGQVLYTTTSMNPIENEAVVMAILKETLGSVELVDCSAKLTGFKYHGGMTSWKVMENDGLHVERWYEDFGFPESVFSPPSKEALAFNMERCVRVLPHDNNSAGFFCAVLVKNTELPWIRGKIIQEMAEARSNPSVEEAPKLKEYGYTIQLKCHLAVEAIEWTTETTDDNLHTTSKIKTSYFKAPEEEIDPICQPTALIPGIADKFAFCENNTPEWLQIKEFFSISDDFDPTCMRRNSLKEFYYSTTLLRTLISYNRDLIDSKFGKGFGVGFFFEMPELCMEVETKCPLMMSKEALALMYPFIGKQIINIDQNDLLKLVYNEKVKIDDFSEKAKADIKETDTGCVLYIYRPADLNSVPSCNISFNGVRNDNYCIDFREGKEFRRDRHFFRLAGMELEDYGRKLQEDKMALIIAKYKEETAKESPMET